VIVIIIELHNLSLPFPCFIRWTCVLCNFPCTCVCRRDYLFTYLFNWVGAWLINSDITLRMLIDDRYCGRIIGREGKTVKKIREDTGTRISISKYTALLFSLFNQFILH